MKYINHVWVRETPQLACVKQTPHSSMILTCASIDYLSCFPVRQRWRLASLVFFVLLFLFLYCLSGRKGEEKHKRCALFRIGLWVLM